jgi:hypothetical protein
LEPEKKLMLAILEDAVACFQKFLLARDSKGKAQFRDTEDWIFQGTDLGIFSFDIVCETLGLEPNYVRRGLAHWKKQRLAQQPHPGHITAAAAHKHTVAGAVRPKLGAPGGGPLPITISCAPAVGTQCRRCCIGVNLQSSQNEFINHLWRC